MNKQIVYHIVYWSIAVLYFLKIAEVQYDTMLIISFIYMSITFMLPNNKE